jgi:GH15 family glucan-1,4-alpha-glucosidase
MSSKPIADYTSAPECDRLLGNFPQAFSHIGSIKAAADIDRAREGVAA